MAEKSILQIFRKESSTSKWWLSFKVETWKFTINKLNASEFNSSRLSICRLKFEQNYSEKGTFYGPWFETVVFNLVVATPWVLFAFFRSQVLQKYL